MTRTMQNIDPLSNEPTMPETVSQRGAAKRTKLASSKPIALRLTPAERDTAMASASKEGRSASNFVRYIYLRGLADYLNGSGASHG